MTLEDIESQWEVDSRIDHTELGSESLRTSELHCKYYRMFGRERLVKRKLESDLRELRLAKHEFYLHGPSRETEAKGWKATGVRILKQDVGTYIDGDPDIAEATLRLGYAQEKVDFLESIIRVISNRNYAIKNAVDFLRFTQGA
jgi:recombination/repair/ssDNA binding protein UvsY